MIIMSSLNYYIGRGTDVNLRFIQTFISSSKQRTMAGINSKAKLRTILQDLNFGLNDKDIEFLLNDGKKCIDDSNILVLRLGILKEYADVIVEILRNATETVIITNEDARRIDQSLQEYPSMNTPFVLSLALGIDEEVVAAHLTTKQEREMQSDIRSSPRLHFAGKKGEKALSLIRKYFPNLTEEIIRKSIVKNDLQMKDKLICVMKREKLRDHSQLVAYLEKFKDSKNFVKVDVNLTFDDIKLINASDCNVDELSKKIHKVRTVIIEFLERYVPREVETSGYKRLQCVEIEGVMKEFGTRPKTFHVYRMIIVNPIDQVIDASRKLGKEGIFANFLPWMFYYIKCYLPLNTIRTVIQDKFHINLTTHQIFHVIFQLSDSLLRGFCIEHYSYSNSVPLYYPTFATLKNRECKFEVCKELWYSIGKNRGLVSFGLGQAAFSCFGKSSILDLIFMTNFAEGNPRNSPFHFKSVDIQMYNNLYAEDPAEWIKWAFIDCSGYVGHDVIHAICQQLHIAVVHVSYHDYVYNRKQLLNEICGFKTMKHLYVFVRDCVKPDVKVEMINNRCYVFIPNCTKHDKNDFLSQLREIGKEILSLPTEPCVTGGFIESIMNKLGTPGMEKLQIDNQLVDEIMGYITNRIDFSVELNFSFLNFYPIFIEYMRLYYLTFSETKRDEIICYNKNRVMLKEQLNGTEISDIVMCFNKILVRSDSILILWKLSQNLSALTDKMNSKKSANDKYNLEILWREALLSYKYGRKDSYIHKLFENDFAMNFCNYVERGEAFELIDGDNLRYFNQDINALLSPLYSKQSEEIKNYEKGNKIKMKQAPIVVSIFGPQSSGKSTLLNYCFGCKFLTSAGRCTRGIYICLSCQAKYTC